MYVSEKASGEVKSFSQVMKDAADLIDKRGLSQRNFYGWGGSLCTWAAIAEAQGLVPAVLEFKDTEYHRRFSRWLRSSGQISFYSNLCSWNNSSTKSQVVVGLRRAAVEA